MVPLAQWQLSNSKPVTMHLKVRTPAVVNSIFPATSATPAHCERRVVMDCAHYAGNSKILANVDATRRSTSSRPTVRFAKALMGDLDSIVAHQTGCKRPTGFQSSIMIMYTKPKRSPRQRAQMLNNHHHDYVLSSPYDRIKEHSPLVLARMTVLQSDVLAVQCALDSLLALSLHRLHSHMAAFISSLQTSYSPSTA